MAFLAALPAVIGIAEAAIDLVSITTTAFEIAGAVDASGAIVAAALSDAAATTGGGALTQGLAKQVARRAFTEASEAVVEKGLKKGTDAILKTAGRKATRASIKKGITRSLQKLFLRLGLGSFAQILEFVLSVTVFVLTLLFRTHIKRAMGWSAEQIKSWFHTEKKKRHKEVMLKFRSHTHLMMDALRFIDAADPPRKRPKSKKSRRTS